MVIYYHEFFNRKLQIESLRFSIMDSKEVLKIYMTKFSENLNRIREEKYETMHDVGTNSSFDPSNYNKFEKGKGNPTLETILKLASVMQIDPKDLFDFDFDIKKHKIEM